VPRADSARAAGPQPPAEGTPSLAALRAALARSEAALRRASARRDALYAQLDARVLLPAWLDDFAHPRLAAYFGAPLPRVCAALAGGLAGAPVVAKRLERSEYSPIDVHALNYVWRGAARTCEHWYTLDATDIYAMARGGSIWGTGADEDGHAVVHAAAELECLRGVGAGAEARVLEVLEALPDEQLWLPALVLSSFGFAHGSLWWEPPPELLTGKRRRAQAAPASPSVRDAATDETDD
jgi:hypothetical protein